jgi:phage terminase small subunit
MNNKQLVTADDFAMSPEMAALPTAKQRAFVDSLFEIDGRGQPLTAAAAARAAGYSPDGDSHAHNSAAQKLVKDPRVQAALQAEARRRARFLSPEALQAIKEIIGDRYHKDRLKAAHLILERVDPTVQRVDAHVTHEVVDHKRDAIDQLRTLKALGVAREKLEELFGFSGLPALERQLVEQEARRPIDAEFVELREEDWENE